MTDGIRQSRDLEQVAGERIGEHAARAHAHRAEGVAVIGMLERDDHASRRAAIDPVLQCDLYRDLDGRRAVVGKEHARDHSEPGARAAPRARRRERA